MYPTVVILLVETQRSMTDICEISPSNASKLAASSEARPATSGHLSFAVGPVDITTDDEAESQLKGELGCQRLTDTITIPSDLMFNVTYQ